MAHPRHLNTDAPWRDSSLEQARHFAVADSTFDQANACEEAALTQVMETIVAPERSPESSTSERVTEPSENALGKSTALMSVLILISRITGFMRTWGQAWAIGVSVMASCYSIANNLPNVLYDLVAAGMLTTAFLPIYMAAKKQHGQDHANRYASNLTTLVYLFMGLITLISLVFAAQIVYTQSFSATTEFDVDLTIFFFRFFAIEVLLYALSSIYSGILNAERAYFWGQAAPIFNNVVTTLSFVLYSIFASSMPQIALLILAVGNPLGVLIQVWLMWRPLKRHGVRLRFYLNWHDPLLKETFKVGIPTLLVVFAAFISNAVVNSSALSTMATGASINYYARLWYLLPYSLLAVPISTALFTELSDYWNQNNIVKFKESLVLGIRQTIFFTLPSTLLLVVFSYPLTALIAGSKFSPEDTLITAQYLAILALSLPFWALYMYVQKVASAMRAMAMCAVGILIAVTIQVILLVFLTPHMGLLFVAFSSTIFNAIAVCGVLFGLKKRLGTLNGRTIVQSILKTIFCSLLGCIGAVILGGGLYLLIGSPLGSVVKALLYCVCAGLPSFIVIYVLAAWWKMPEAALFDRVLKRVIPR